MAERDAVDERKVGPGTGDTADPEAEVSADEARKEAGTGAHGNASDSGHPTGTGRPMISDEDNRAED